MPAPVGLIENLYELKRVSDIQATLTHNTPEGWDLHCASVNGSLF